MVLIIDQRSSESQTLLSSLLYMNSSFQVAKRIRLSGDITSGENKSKSDRLSSRNYNIQSTTITPGVEATINRSWQSSLSISYALKEDRFPEDPVTAKI